MRWPLDKVIKKLGFDSGFKDWFLLNICNACNIIGPEFELIHTWHTMQPGLLMDIPFAVPIAYELCRPFFKRVNLFVITYHETFVDVVSRQMQISDTPSSLTLGVLSLDLYASASARFIVHHKFAFIPSNHYILYRTIIKRVLYQSYVHSMAPNKGSLLRFDGTPRSWKSYIYPRIVSISL